MGTIFQKESAIAAAKISKVFVSPSSNNKKGIAPSMWNIGASSITFLARKEKVYIETYIFKLKTDVYTSHVYKITFNISSTFLKRENWIGRCFLDRNKGFNLYF